VALSSSSAWAQGGPWWNASWAARRALRLDKPVSSRFEGDEVAVVTLPTAGMAAPDGRDVRILTGGGKVVAHRVLQAGPGDSLRIAFAQDGKQTTYFAYFGNAQAEAPEDELVLRRGVLLETWVNPDGNPRTFRETMQVFQEAKVLIGRSLRDRMSLGHNPHGPQNRICRIFTGWALCPASGEYTFAVASQNAAFLEVDGKEVVRRGGARRVHRRDYTRGRIRLEAGIHQVRLYHVTRGGYPVSMVAWQRPGSGQLVPMGSGAFAAFCRAEPGPLALYGRRGNIDFLWDHANETFHGGWYYQRYRFRAQKVGDLPPVQWHWDFGDGQQARGEQVEHVYLLPGSYTVTLTARSGANKLTRTNRIVVSRDWDRVTSEKIDPVGAHAAIVAGYDFSKLTPGANAHAVLLLGSDAAAHEASVLKAGEALVGREEVPGRLLVDAMKLYRDALLGKDRAPEVAQALVLASKAADASRYKAELLVLAGRVCLKKQGDLQAAGKWFLQAQEVAGESARQALRDARVGLGDVYRAMARRKQALETYRSAGDRVPQQHRTRMIYQGNLARHVEAFLREAQYQEAREMLEQWGHDLPADKIEGYWSWMVARAAMGRGDHQAVVAEAQTLVNVNPVSNYGARLLLLAYEARRAMGQKDLAGKCLKRIMKEFPESPLAQEAARKLKIEEQ
jgi:tetratricopeptide (TPR) repeat protein